MVRSVLCDEVSLGSPIVLLERCYIPSLSQDEAFKKVSRNYPKSLQEQNTLSDNMASLTTRL